MTRTDLKMVDTSAVISAWFQDVGNPARLISLAEYPSAAINFFALF
jgi:hypothetical protein